MAGRGDGKEVRRWVCHSIKEKDGGQGEEELLHDHNHDGITGVDFLKCMAWAGTGAFW